ncbi:MAG TPA: hypothetical protein VJM32_06400 [Candidatus Saccharimonadales bacterium]|nr:hypothetical protein [Candidatus Saccharimonadales bacterium]
MTLAPAATGTVIEPFAYDVPDSSADLAATAGNALRTLASTYLALRRIGSATVVSDLKARFTSNVSHVEHNFDVEILGAPYGVLECRLGIICGDYNLVTDDDDHLLHALADHFNTKLTVHTTDGMVEFQIGLDDLFA